MEFSLMVAVFSLLLQATATTALEGCPHTTTRWTAYGPDANPQTLRCDSPMRQWWQREMRYGRRAGCELNETEWQRVEDCRDSATCDRGVDSSTTALEYCCTEGENPALTEPEERKCFTLAVCPMVASVTIPPKLFAGTQASFYVTVNTHSPSAFTYAPPVSPISYTPPESPPRTLLPQITTHTDFPDVTVAYSFTVPSDGVVNINLNGLSPTDGSCEGTLDTSRGTYDREIVQGVLETVEQPSPTSEEPLCPTITPPPAEAVTVTVTEVIHTTPTPSPSSPASPASPSPPSPTSSPSSPSPSSLPTDTSCSAASKDGDMRMLLVGVIVGVVIGVVVTVFVIVVVVVMRFLRRWCLRMQVSSRKSSLSVPSPDSPVEDSIKPILNHSFSPPPPTSPAPPLPSSPPSQSHHLIIASSHGSSHEDGAMVTAPSPSSQQGIYSLPDQLTYTSHPSPHHTGTTPHHTITEQHCHSTANWQFHSNCSEPVKYAFFNGKLYREDGVEYLDPSRNIGPSISV